MINSHWQTKDQNWDPSGFGPNLGPQRFWTKIGTPVVLDQIWDSGGFGQKIETPVVLDQNWDPSGFGPKLGPQWFWTKIGTPVVSDQNWVPSGFGPKLGPQWFWTICAKTYNCYCSHNVFLVKTTPWRFYGLPTNQNWTPVVFVHLCKNLQLSLKLYLKLFSTVDIFPYWLQLTI